MKKKLLGVIIFVFFYALCFAQSEYTSLELFHFGSEKYENALVLCFTQTNAKQASDFIEQVKKIVQNFSFPTETDARAFTLLIAISKNDYTDLPNDVAVKSFIGMNELISEITKYKRSSIFIFNEGERANISYQVGKVKSPSWMIKLFSHSLTETSFTMTSKIFSLDAYNNRNIETLKLFFDENIPALLVQTKPDIDITRLIKNINQNYLDHFSNDWEQNYFLLRYFNNLKIISESTSVGFIIIFLVIIFLNLFFKSVITEKKFTVKNLVVNFFLYGMLVLINFIFLLLAKNFTDFLFATVIDSKKIIPQFNVYYIVIFITVWIFEILLLQSPIVITLKKTSFTADTFSAVYPHFCLINFFVLTIFDFSLYPFVFFTYAVSNLFSLAKNNIGKVLVLFVSFISMLFYFIVVIGDSTVMIDIIRFKTLFLSLLTVPILLIFTISYAISKKYFKRKFFISLLSAVLVGAITLLIFSSTVQKYNIPVEIRQTFTDTKNAVAITSEYRIKDTLQPENIPDKTKTSAAYIDVDGSLENYLDRSIGVLRINSPLKIEAIQVFVSRATEVAVYEADKSFTQTDDGVLFLSSQNPEQPFVINFSSEKNAVLHVQVRIFSYDNPFNTKLQTTKSKTRRRYEEKFLLEAATEFQLIAE